MTPAGSPGLHAAGGSVAGERPAPPWIPDGPGGLLGRSGCRGQDVALGELGQVWYTAVSLRLSQTPTGHRVPAFQPIGARHGAQRMRCRCRKPPGSLWRIFSSCSTCVGLLWKSCPHKDLAFTIAISPLRYSRVLAAFKQRPFCEGRSLSAPGCDLWSQVPGSR
jgi:hypothetical protein